MHRPWIAPGADGPDLEEPFGGGNYPNAAVGVYGRKPYTEAENVCLSNR